MIPLPIWFRPWMWKAAAAVAIAAFVWWQIHAYGAKRYEAGRQEIIQQDLRLLQERLVANAAQAEKDKAAITAAKVQYEELESKSSDVAADLGRRLGMCVTASRRPSPMPTAAPATGVVAGTTGEPSPDGAVVELIKGTIAACARDANRLKVLQDLVDPRRN